MTAAILSAAFWALAVTAQRTQTRWGQCGGSDYDGPTACPSEFQCTVGNPWYAQCVPNELPEPATAPGAPDETFLGVPDSPIATTSFATVITVAAPSPNAPSTVMTTYITFLTPKPTPAASFTAPPESATLVPDDPLTFSPIRREERRQADAQAARKKTSKRRPQVAARGDPTPPQLKAGQYWIRAVAPPHFHEYLQTDPQNEPSVALMGSHTTAGQYNIIDGQLVSAGSDDVLYMHVEKPDDFTQRKLATWFNTTQNEFGTFAFSGDAVTWSAPEVRRENLAAWLVCEKNELFINTGAYGYMTPAGCDDQTIHYYNGATANN